MGKHCHLPLGQRGTSDHLTESLRVARGTSEGRDDGEEDRNLYTGI